MGVSRRRQIANIDFVKYSKQRATTLKLDPSPVAGEDHPRRRAPWRSAMCVVVGGLREHQRTPHGQLSDARVVTWQMTVVEIIIADLRCLSNGGCHVGLCVIVNMVCAGDQCTCETTWAVRVT